MQNEDINYQNSVKVITLEIIFMKMILIMLIFVKLIRRDSDKLVIRGLHEYLENRSIKYFIFEYENKISYEKIKNILSNNNYNSTSW